MRWEDVRKMAIAVFTAGVILLIIYFHWWPYGILVKKAEALDKDITDISQRTNNIFPKSAYSGPIKKTQEMILERNKILKADFASLIDTVSMAPRGQYVLPKEEKRPGQYFIEQLSATRDYLYVYIGSRQKKMDFPKTMGFASDIETRHPPAEQVPELLRKLYMTKELIELATEADIESVKSISLQNSQKTGMANQKEFITEYPVNLTMTGDGELKSLMRFLYSLRAENRYYVVRDIHIKALDEYGEKVEINISAASMDISKETALQIEEEKPEEKSVNKVWKRGPSKGY